MEEKKNILELDNLGATLNLSKYSQDELKFLNEIINNVKSLKKIVDETNKRTANAETILEKILEEAFTFKSKLEQKNHSNFSGGGKAAFFDKTLSEPEVGYMVISLPTEILEKNLEKQCIEINNRLRNFFPKEDFSDEDALDDFEVATHFFQRKNSAESFLIKKLDSKKTEFNYILELDIDDEDKVIELLKENQFCKKIKKITSSAELLNERHQLREFSCN